MNARPELCVGAIAVSDGRLLLVRRGHAPSAGLWSVPGGRVEEGEALAAAVRRELVEEVGVDGTVRHLVGIAERVGPGYHFVILDYAVEVDGATPLRPGDDAADAAWAPLAELGERNDLVPGLVEFLREHGVLTAG